MSEVAVRLSPEEWQRVLSVLSQAPWSTANPLIMKIGEQLRTVDAERALQQGAADRKAAN